MYIASIERTKKITIMPNTPIELKLSIDGRLVYNICEEYPLGYMDVVSVPYGEELEIEIKVIRRVKT